MAETKIIYHIDEEETPYLVKIPIAAENITLLDFKQVLNKPNYKFFFKSMDQDFGWAPVISFLPPSLSLVEGELWALHAK